LTWLKSEFHQKDFLYL